MKYFSFSFLFFSFFAQGQVSSYPKSYFRNPMQFPLEIVSNFGELRPNHWHMGLDIRTQQRENMPVHAAAAGYISYVGIRPSSFGRFIIIAHPNGLSTLYAHLNRFYEELEEYVTTQQYNQKSWAVELTVPKGKFNVNKGGFIANSGNTGGSQGPHLHFEILDTKTTKRLNPLLFDFDIADHTAPTLIKLAVYNRGLSIYNQTPLLYSLKKTDSGYIIPKLPIIKTGWNKVSFAIQAYDRVDKSNNPNGIYSACLIKDDERLLEFVLDSIDYKETAYMNAHIDYKYKSNGGAYLQHLSKMPGDAGSVYHAIKNDAVLLLKDSNTYAMRVEVKDAQLNVSTIHFAIQHDESLAAKTTKGNEGISFIPNEVNVFEKQEFEVYLSENSLYDTVSATYAAAKSGAANSISANHFFCDPNIPLNADISIRIKPDKLVPAEIKDKIVIKRIGKGSQVQKAIWQGHWLAAQFGDFGSFQAFADVEPPQIEDIGKGDTIDLSATSRIAFWPKDNFGIKKFYAELDGKWLRFTNDKAAAWLYYFDERCPFGEHELKVTVEDLVGNVTSKTWWFKRYPYTPPAPKKKSISKKKSSNKKTTATKKKKK